MARHTSATNEVAGVRERNGHNTIDAVVIATQPTAHPIMRSGSVVPHRPAVVAKSSDSATGKRAAKNGPPRVPRNMVANTMTPVTTTSATSCPASAAPNGSITSDAIAA